MRIRMTWVLEALLTELLLAAKTGRTGAALIAETGYESGTLYPLLGKLIGAGYVGTAATPEERGCTYFITDEGRVWALEQLRPQLQRVFRLASQLSFV